MKKEVAFLPADKLQRFLLSGTIILDLCGQAYLITQNEKFAISLQCLKKDVSAEVDFLYSDKHEILLQIDTIYNFDGDGQAFLEFPK